MTHGLENFMRKLIGFFFLFFTLSSVQALPRHFVYLHEIAPSVKIDMRYASANNFTAKQVPGYEKPTCILTEEAAQALAKIQKQANQLGYSLKVYDCYRPTRAVQAFYRWSQTDDRATKPYYYPRVAKNQLFAEGYIALSSSHSRGSTVDLTLVRRPIQQEQKKATIQCYGKDTAYLNDESIDTGTRFDCLDPAAHVFYPNLAKLQKRNRMLLRRLMLKNGFNPYPQEWWHFTLKNEPYPNRYFDFTVR